MNRLPHILVSGASLLLLLSLISCTTVSTSEPIPILPSSPASSRSPAEEGGIQGGGGGDFNVAVFWHETQRALLPVLTENNFVNLLKKPDLDKLRILMDPNVTRVSLTDDVLYIHGPDGRSKLRVDAVNFPDRTPKEILIYRPTWQYFFTHDVEIRQLILHEFLGLAKISDLGYNLSSQYFPPRTRLISFNFKKMNCNVSSWMMVWDRARFTILNAYPIEQNQSTWPTVEFSQPVKTGAKAATCFPLETADQCAKKDLSRLAKYARLDLDFKINTLPANPQLNQIAEKHEFPVYSLHLMATLESEHFTYGWGGSTGLRELIPPQLSIFSRVQALNSKTGASKVLAASEVTYEQGNQLGSRFFADSFSFQYLNPEVVNTMAKAGAEFRLDPATAHEGGGSGIMNIYNFWTMLANAAHLAGAKSDADIDTYLKTRVFNDFPDAFPVWVYGECRLTK